LSGFGRRALSAYSVVANRSPGLAYASLGGLARIPAPTRDRQIPPRRIAELFPHLSAAEVQATARRSWTNRLRDGTLTATRRRYGLEALRALVVDNPEVRALRAPLILASFHVGALRAMGAVLEQLPGETALMAGGIGHDIPRNITPLMTGEGQPDCIRMFLRARQALAAGAFVFVPLDGPFGTRVHAPLLGAKVGLGRGGLALARHAQVPIVPLVARWEGLRIVSIVSDAIAPEESDDATAASVARWLERYLLEHPGELSKHLLDLVGDDEPLSRSGH